MLVWKQPQIWTTTHFFDNSFKFGIIRKAGNVTVGFFFFFENSTVLFRIIKGAKIKVESYRPVLLASVEFSVNLRDGWKEVQR